MWKHFFVFALIFSASVHFSVHSRSDSYKSLVYLAKEKFHPSELNETEKKILESIQEGSFLILSDPENPIPEESRPVIKSRLIEWLCTDKQAMEKITHNGIWVEGVIFSGILDLENANIPFILSFHNCVFSEDIYLNQSSIFSISFRKSKIYSIKGQSAYIKHNIFLNDGFEAKDTVDLSGSIIGGNIDCSGGVFLNKEVSLRMQQAKISRNIFLRNHFQAKGTVDLLHAKVLGDIDCMNGRFLGQDISIQAEKAEIGRSLILSEGFMTEGSVNATGAKIKSNVECSNGKFSNKDSSFILKSSTIDDSLIMNENTKISGELDLRFAKIRMLWDEKNSWPEQNKLLLDGLFYQRIFEQEKLNPRERIQWIRLEKNFYPQPYEQLASLYRKSGKYEEAKEVMIASKEDPRRLKKHTYLERFLHYLLGLTLDYGHSPWKILYYAIPIIITGWTIFDIGKRKRIMIPTRSYEFTQHAHHKKKHKSIHAHHKETHHIHHEEHHEQDEEEHHEEEIHQDEHHENEHLPKKLHEEEHHASVRHKHAHHKKKPKDYPEFYPLIYSLDIFIPLVDLYQKKYWIPSGHSKPFWHAYLCFQTSMGWLIFSFFLAGSIGLIK